MTSSQAKAVADLVLNEGLHDWVPIDTLLWHASEAANGSTHKDLTIEALDYLLSSGLAQAGDLGDTGFEAWTTTPLQTIERIRAALDKTNWQPFGGLCWLDNTAKGDQHTKKPT